MGPGRLIYAFVEFPNHDLALTAVKKLRKVEHSEMNGSRFWVQLEFSPKGKTRFVRLSNLRPGVSKQDVANLLWNVHGMRKSPPKSIHMKDPDSVIGKVGAAFVECSTVEWANKLSEQLNDKELNEWKISTLCVIANDYAKLGRVSKAKYGKLRMKAVQSLNLKRLKRIGKMKLKRKKMNERTRRLSKQMKF